MKIMKWLVFALLVAALVAAFFGWQRAQQSRAELESLRAQAQTLEDQRASEEETRSKQRDTELQRLRAEAQEVHKLRNEVRQLRAGANEAEKLRAENQQLRAAASAVTASPAPAPTPAAASSRFPKEAWAFSGYATPEAALVSAVWAMKEGNPKAYLDSLSPEEQVRMAKSWENKSEAEVAAKHQADVASIKGVWILEQKSVKDDEIVLTVHIEGPGKNDQVSMKRVGNDWKFGGFFSTRGK
jgi:hypothetical protein